MREIMLSNNRGIALVDDEDYEYLSQFKWRLIAGYAARTPKYRDENNIRKSRTVSMHSVIKGKIAGLQIDHINGNRLDNRKENLRHVTHKQNQQNKKVSKHSTSGFKGVGWCKQTKKWKVSMSVDGKSKTWGRFNCLGIAAKKYNELAKIYHGEYARLNKI